MDTAVAPRHSSTISGPRAEQTQNEGRSIEISPRILGQRETSIMLCECLRGKRQKRWFATPATNEALERTDVTCQCRAGGKRRKMLLLKKFRREDRQWGGRKGL